MPTAAAREPASDIFASPRVVDHDAFLEYAGALRDLVRESAELRASLRTEVDRARALADDLSGRWGSGGADRRRVEAVGEALRAVESKLNHARDTLDRLAPEDDFEARLDEVRRAFTERLRAAQHDQELAVRALQEAMDERLAEIEARMTRRLRMTVDETERGVQAAAQRLLDLLDRAQTFASDDAGLPQLLDGLDRSRALASESRGELEDARREADESLSRLSPALAAAHRELDALERRRSAVLESVREAVDLCRAAGAAIDTRLDRARQPGSSEP